MGCITFNINILRRLLSYSPSHFWRTIKYGLSSRFQSSNSRYSFDRFWLIIFSFKSALSNIQIRISTLTWFTSNNIDLRPQRKDRLCAFALRNLAVPTEVQTLQQTAFHRTLPSPIKIWKITAQRCWFGQYGKRKICICKFWSRRWRKSSIKICK